MNSDYPHTPKVIKDALFSCVIRDFKTDNDKKLNDFLFDILNECERVFSERSKQ